MIRASDIFLSLLAITILSPLLIIISFILRFTGEKEVFYKQERIGRGGESFALMKFATMLKDSPNIGSGEITLKSDPRVLPFGVFLRKSKINELPQLWNIVIGDMSIVGPRPMVPNTYIHYSDNAQKHINKVRPGLTGIGSIVFRDEEQYLVDQIDPMKYYIENIIPYKSDLEIWFIENMSLLLYIKIIYVTAWIVVFPKSNIADFFFPKIPKNPINL